MYPNGSFAEHLYAYYLKGHSRIMAYTEYDWKDSLESDYKNFITEYPNSNYLLIDRFVAPYIYKHFIELNNLKDSFESEIEDFKSLNKNNALRIFLNDKRRSKRILRIE
jgi:outer membrane protein assembly factor BamD (BamD/ComL family)